MLRKDARAWAKETHHPVHGLQVYTMQQSATVLVELAPDRPLTEHPINDIAKEQGLPCKQDMLADADDCLSKQDWNMFVQYAERVDCFKQLYTESVPIAIFGRSNAAPGVTLY